MNRLLAALAASAFALSLGSSAMAATTKPATMTKMTQCVKGQKWVKGYTTKKGVKVKGYCRK